jgi:hypothetical protein
VGGEVVRSDTSQRPAVAPEWRPDCVEEEALVHSPSPAVSSSRSPPQRARKEGWRRSRAAARPSR